MDRSTSDARRATPTAPRRRFPCASAGLGSLAALATLPRGALAQAAHGRGYGGRDPKRVAGFVASLDLGVDAEAFARTMGSFAVQTALRRSVGLARGAGIAGVPSILINGRYLTGNALAGSHAGTVDAIDRLTAEEHAAS